MPILITVTSAVKTAEVFCLLANLFVCFVRGVQRANTFPSRRLQESERLVHDMEKAWAAYLPSVDLQEALRTVRLHDDSTPVVPKKIKHHHDLTHSTEQPPTSVAEHSNAEDYEFDESQDFDNSTDGMGFLTIDPHKAGYTGPQSGVAALKFLQSLPLYIPLSSFIPASSLDDDDISDFALPRKQSEVTRYLDDYFTFYHPAYPILHEGTFRARVSGESQMVLSAVSGL